MNVGMLWFDNDPKAGLSDKIERAASYYRNKYGRIPTVCFVHPSMLPADPAHVTGQETHSFPTKNNGILVKSSRSVLPNHFWIGVNGSEDSNAH